MKISLSSPTNIDERLILLGRIIVRINLKSEWLGSLRIRQEDTPTELQDREFAFDQCIKFPSPGHMVDHRS